MNLLFRALAIVLFTANSFAEGVSQYISNLIPGEGDTEVSIDFRENHKPDYSILAVREIEKTETGNIFTQLSLFNTEKNNDERIVGNIGFGRRSLSDDKTILTGFNSFIDYDDNDNARMSLGVEARSAVLEFWFNQYFGISDGKDEKVLDGYDLRLSSQIPYLHWGDFFINAYEWEGKDRDDIKGKKTRFRIIINSKY